MEVLLVDEAVPVLVDHVEGLLELLDLGLVEHGKHVGGGPLGALLGGLALGTLAGHDGGWMTAWGRTKVGRVSYALHVNSLLRIDIILHSFIFDISYSECRVRSQLLSPAAVVLHIDCENGSRGRQN